VKELFVYLRDNLPNIFSVVGICLTVYFAVFYVPNYVQEIEIKKIEGTHESLVESIQELVYNDHDIDSDDINTLIRGKELSGQLIYPFTSEELLIQVQDRFLENKFIPLDQRKALIEKIDKIRKALPKTTITSSTSDSQTKMSILYSWASALLGLIVAVFGFASIWKRTKELEEIKLETTIDDRQESIKQNVHRSILMERNMHDVLKGAFGQDHVEYCHPSSPVDFILRNISGMDAAVEVIYTETEVIPLSTIKRLTTVAEKLGMPLFLISNANLTIIANKMLTAFNTNNINTPISHINIDESKDVVKDISSMLKIDNNGR
jgi:hypothetical protein